MTFTHPDDACSRYYTLGASLSKPAGADLFPEVGVMCNACESVVGPMLTAKDKLKGKVRTGRNDTKLVCGACRKPWTGRKVWDEKGASGKGKKYGARRRSESPAQEMFATLGFIFSEWGNLDSSRAWLDSAQSRTWKWHFRIYVQLYAGPQAGGYARVAHIANEIWPRCPHAIHSHSVRQWIDGGRDELRRRLVIRGLM